jgi:hypothetical protein
MEKPLGFVTSAKWLAKQLNDLPAVWAGSAARGELTGQLQAVRCGEGMIVTFKTAQGYQRDLTQSELEAASIDPKGVFRFGEMTSHPPKSAQRQQ